MSPGRSFTKKRSVKSGLPPGSLVHIGETRDAAPRITLARYNLEKFEEHHFSQPEECASLLEDGANAITWLNIEGLHDVELIKNLGTGFRLHPLVLEDVVNTVQRPKVEDYGNYLFIVLRMLQPTREGEFSSEQLSIILADNLMLTFQEGINGDAFEGLRERIRNGKGRIRSMGADYLAYALIDAIVDSYFNVLEEFGERIVNVEETLTLAPNRSTMHLINNMKKEIIFLRKAVWPLREVISFLERGDSSLLGEGCRVYFRDVYDHTIQAIDTVETYRDLLSGMLDLYISSIGNRTNEVMKFLTVIGTIFLPLTFLVGVYGMNFKHMPELEWAYGYYGLWLFMLLLSAAMIVYFKKKKWL